MADVYQRFVELLAIEIVFSARKQACSTACAQQIEACASEIVTNCSSELRSRE